MKKSSKTQVLYITLIAITQKLEQLHASGWVKRDLEPGNIIRVPQIHSRTLMDVDSACQTSAPPG